MKELRTIKILAFILTFASVGLMFNQQASAEDCWIIGWEACCNGGCDGTSAAFQQTICEVSGARPPDQMSGCRDVGVASCTCGGGGGGGGGGCADGSWGGCGTNGCGGGDVSYCNAGTWTCLPDPTSCSNPAPPGCNPTSPTQPALRSPANGATLTTINRASLNWAQNGTWGVGCPQNNRYRVEYKVRQGVDCSLGTYTNITNLPSTSHILTGLQPSTTYCWRVMKNNGSRVARSAPWQFTTDVLPAYTMTLSGVTSAWGGFSGYVIPDASEGILIPDLSLDFSDSDFFGSRLALKKVDPYLGTYSVISGTNGILDGRNISSSQIYTRNYKDDALDPSLYGEFNNWFSLLYDKVSKSDLAIKTINQTTNTGSQTSLAAAFGVSVNSKSSVRINGNLVINVGSRCDFKGVIFVNGILDIHPNFTRTSGNGCIFVVSRSVRIRPGAIASFDIIQAFIISNANLITVSDGSNDTLYIHGGVISSGTDLRRTGDGTEVKPREIFEHDAFYINTFRDIFTIDRFSIRER